MTSCTELEQINRLVGGSEPAVLSNWSFFVFLDIAVLRTYEYLRRTGGLACDCAIACLTRCEQQDIVERKMQRHPDQSSVSGGKFSSDHTC